MTTSTILGSDAQSTSPILSFHTCHTSPPCCQLSHDIVEAHCYLVDIGRIDREQIRSRINNNDCRTFRPRRPLSTAYRTFCTQLTKAFVAETSLLTISCHLSPITIHKLTLQLDCFTTLQCVAFLSYQFSPHMLPYQTCRRGKHHQLESQTVTLGLLQASLFFSLLTPLGQPVVTQPWC